MKLPRIGVRSRLLIAIFAAVALALAIALVAFSFLLGQRLSASATSLAKAQAEAELSSVSIRNGKLIAPEGPNDAPVAGHVWVFRGSHVLEAPNVSREVGQAAVQSAMDRNLGPVRGRVNGLRAGRPSESYPSPDVLGSPPSLWSTVRRRWRRRARLRRIAA